MPGAVVGSLARYSRPIALVLAIWSGVTLTVHRWADWHPRSFPLAGLWLILATVGPLAIDFAVKQLEGLGDELSRFASDPEAALGKSQRVVEPILSDRIVTPIGLGLVTIAFLQAQLLVLPWSGLSRVLFLIPAIFFFFVYGVLTAVYLAAARWVWILPAISLRLPRLRLPRLEVAQLHRYCFRLFALASVLYGVGVIALWASPTGVSLARDTGWARFWVFPPAAALLGFLAIVQVRLHHVLRNARDKVLTELNEDLELCAFPGQGGEAVAASRIDALLEWRDHVWSEPVWPLNLKTILVTVVTLLIPTIEALVRLIAG